MGRRELTVNGDTGICRFRGSESDSEEQVLSVTPKQGICAIPPERIREGGVDYQLGWMLPLSGDLPEAPALGRWRRLQLEE